MSLGLLLPQSKHSEFARLTAQHERSDKSCILANDASWSDVGEIWQEASVRLWLEFEKYEPGFDFAAWAVRVAHFQILPWRKNAGRSRLLFGSEFIDRLKFSQQQFFSKRFQARLTALNHCLKNCSEWQRGLSTLFCKSNRRSEQVAAAMRCSVDAVYKSTQRIRKFLRRCIEQTAPECESTSSECSQRSAEQKQLLEPLKTMFNDYKLRPEFCCSDSVPIYSS